MKKIIAILPLLIMLISCDSFGDSLKFGPYLQRPTPDGISILWETDNPASGKVVFGLQAESLSDTLSEDSTATFHHIRLSGLEPNTVYYYRCFWAGDSTEVFSFKTAPDNDETPFRICVVGDSRSNPKIFHRICEQIEKYKPDIILHSGDLVAAGDHIEQWKPQFFDPAKKLISHIPIYTALGNHERRAGYYYQHFTIHQGMPYWSADYGSVHIIGLDSNEDGSPNSEQYKWLVQDLKKSKDKPWRIVMFHHPIFHAHPKRPVYDIRYYWSPLFIENEVQLVVTGHDHYYLRTYPIGKRGEKDKAFVQCVSAGGGAPLYDFKKNQFTDVVQGKHHFMILDVTKDKITARAISINDSVFDQFEIDRGKPFAEENFIEWSAVQLAAKAKTALSSVKPSAQQAGKYIFDSNIAIPTEFNFPTIGYYQWKSEGNWNFSPPAKMMFQLAPAQPLVIPMKASVPEDKTSPSPELVIHIDADSTAGSREQFSNKDIRIKLEDAQFLRIQVADEKKVDEILQFMDFYTNGNHFDEAVKKLSAILLKNKSEADLTPIDSFLRKHPQPEFRYQLYPFYFIKGDYSKLAEWQELAEKFAPDKIDLPSSLVARFVFNKKFPGKIISDWAVAGLLPYSEIDGQGRDLQKMISLIKDNNLTWQPAQASKWGFVNFVNIFGEKRKVTSFAKATIEAKKDGKAVLFFGSDDGAIVWVNGKKIFSHAKGRSARPCDEIIPVRLRKGKNEIFIQLNQIDVDWGFYLQIGDPLGIL
ncbi:MAG: hypothetical protein GXO74_04475 [Calditrichaeota bacterium]|nr:hypothetical protein [Calditrichota bacterium]